MGREFTVGQPLAKKRVSANNRSEERRRTVTTFTSLVSQDTRRRSSESLIDRGVIRVSLKKKSTIQRETLYTGEIERRQLQRVRAKTRHKETREKKKQRKMSSRTFHAFAYRARRVYTVLMFFTILLPASIPKQIKYNRADAQTSRAAASTFTAAHNGGLSPL